MNFIFCIGPRQPPVVIPFQQKGEQQIVPFPVQQQQQPLVVPITGLSFWLVIKNLLQKIH